MDTSDKKPNDWNTFEHYNVISFSAGKVDKVSCKHCAWGRASGVAKNISRLWIHFRDFHRLMLQQRVLVDGSGELQVAPVAAPAQPQMAENVIASPPPAKKPKQTFIAQYGDKPWTEAQQNFAEERFRV